jgi:hypothetical protein
MQILGERCSELRVVGRSAISGFYVYGDVRTADLLDAAREGLRRLKAGQRDMAIHPHCGSNYAVAGAIAGVGAFLALGGLSRSRRKSFLDRLARLPLACAVATLALIVSRPLGPALQAHVTTQPDVGDLSVDGITRQERAGTAVHFVRTAG